MVAEKRAGAALAPWSDASKGETAQTPLQRRALLTGRLERPAPDLRVLGRLGAVGGAKSPSSAYYVLTGAVWPSGLVR